jgi:flavin reductase (DIM6/NTAB) family NADH-FMN oxidoreductase RutF/rubredoxin
MDLKALYKLGYGLYVVTSRKGDKFNGQIANTVFQVTSEPPTIAVSINRRNLTWEYIDASGVLAVSILCEDTPLSFIGQFGFKSGRDTDKFEGVEYKLGETGVPIVLDNCVSCFEAKVIDRLDVGTHTIFVAEVIGAEVVSDRTCMTYEHYHEVKRGTTPPSAPSYIPEAAPTTATAAAASSPKYRCTKCNWEYDPALGDAIGGIAPGTPFSELPDDWVCPICGAAKSAFVPA